MHDDKQVRALLQMDAFAQNSIRNMQFDCPLPLVMCMWFAKHSMHVHAGHCVPVMHAIRYTCSWLA